MSWNVDSTSFSSSVLEEIVSWIMKRTDYGAILKDSATDDIFVYHSRTQS